MADSERIAIAAHLHVALRRKAGRVTDIDWMTENDEYAHAIVQFAHAKAIEETDDSLRTLAYKLETLLHAESHPKIARPPLLQRMHNDASASSRAKPNVATASDPISQETLTPRYIGGLR